MRLAALDRLAGGVERLADDLAAEDPQPADAGAATPEQIAFQRLEVEDRQQGVADF